MSIDVISKAESIIKRMDLVINQNFRLGIIDHESNLEVFSLTYKGKKCSSCNSEMSVDDAYWHQDKCKPCERAVFLRNEINKLDADDACIVSRYITHQLTSITPTPRSH